MMAGNYTFLLSCYRSGQVTEAQWQAHLEDAVFEAWLRCHENFKGGVDESRKMLDQNKNLDDFKSEFDGMTRLT